MTTRSGGPVEEPETFAFTAENLEQANTFIARYPEGRQQSAVMPILDLAQRQAGGWLPRVALEHVAGLLDMAPIRVYEVVTFYSMYNLAPVGEHFVRVCTTTPCQLRGADDILKTCEKALGLGLGETTADGRFTLGEVECLGACVNAPVLQIGEDYYEDVDVTRTEAILDALKRGETPAPGPQVERQTSAPVRGQATLLETTG